MRGTSWAAALLSAGLGVAACLEGLTGGPGDAGAEARADASGGDVRSPQDAPDSKSDSGVGAPEASPGCVLPEAGRPCDPGFVQCDQARCMVPSTFCCSTPDGGACETTGTSTCSGLIVECDEAADCPAGEICCLVVTSTSPIQATSSCRSGPCMGGTLAVQLCHSNTECPGGACYPQMCNATFVEGCMQLPFCTPI